MTAVGSGSAFPAIALGTMLVLFGTCGTAASQTVRSCSVNAIQGAPVRIQVADQWSALEMGPLPIGAQRIATGPGARAEIVCDAGLTMTIGVGTEVSLDALLVARGSSEPVLLRLLRGIIGVDAPTPDWGGFELRTPLAIASARSTSWLVEYTEVTGSAVFVRSGSVEVISTLRRPLAVLEEGQGVTIVPTLARSLSPDPASIVVVEWGPARRDGAAASLGFGWQ